MMKRSTSKKGGQQKSEDGTQQKISSFFQPGPVQAQSKLFSKVTAKSKASLSLKRQPSSSKPASANPAHVGQKQQADSNNKHSMTVLKDFNCSDPQHKTPEKSGSRDVPEQGSPEVFVIPDTPESKVSKPWPKPASRSFLCPVSQLSTMPGKKPTQKVKPRRIVKKYLGPVSIEIGKKCQSDVENEESKSKESAMIVDGSPPDHSANYIAKSCAHADSSTVGLGENLNDFYIEPGSLSTGTETLKPQEINNELFSAKQSTTPTKHHSDRNSVKRMAVQGLSPDPKRLFADEAATTEEKSDAKPTISQCKMKAKRQLATLTGFKTVKEMNQSVNKYQLEGRTKSAPKTDSSCTKDDVLEDILGEIANKTPHGKSTEKKGSFPLAQKPDNPVIVHVKVESMETESSFDTSEDDVLKEILGELDNKLCKNASTNISQHSPKLCSQKGGVAANKSRNTTGTKIKPCPFPKGGHSSALTEPHKHIQETENVMNSGNQLTSARQCVQTLQASRTPTKNKREHVKVQAEDAVNTELVSRFGHLSPFKNRESARSSSQTSAQNQSSLKFTDKWNRYTVLSVTRDGSSHDKILELSQDGTTEAVKTARLQGFWSDTHIEHGDIVHLLLDDRGQAFGKSDDEESDDCPVIINDHQGQIVVNPDLLLSGTTIVSGVYCLRRSILNEKFKGVDSKNVHMLYGSIIHSLFQEVLKNRLTKREEIMAAAKSIVKSNKFLHDMYGQCASEAKVMEEIAAYVSPLQSWLHKHVPSVTNTAADRSAGSVSVVQIHDIEETIWSPRIGVKGKIDMTVEVEMQTKGDRRRRRRKVLPLELKTGRASYSVEHKGQVTLYSMMMSDRRENPEEGLLLYLKHNDMSTIPVKPVNTQGLLQLRNEMAYYLSRQAKKTVGEDGRVSHSLGSLPAPINNQRSCAKCPQLVNCAVYQRSIENVEQAPDHAMSSLVPEALSHLGESHLGYFRHWLLCMELETTAQRAEGLRNIWCMSSAEREANGDCLQQLVMVNSVLGVPETQTFMEGQGCCVQFQRKPGFSGGALNMSGLTKNDSVVISSEDGRYIALSTGFVKNVTETILDVVVDRDSFHENAAFRSLVFRVDRSDVFNTAGYLLTNLSRLLEPSPHCQKLRSLIIDGKRPEFQLTMSKSSVEKVKKIFRQLNKPQKTAILKVLMSKDYVLIKGYPGTGKTSTIVALVKILRELGQSVLLTSYTHSAVDNILLKLKKDGVPFLRLGRCSRIHPQVQDHAAETLTPNIASVDQLKDFYSSYGVVATSCLGTNHPVLAQRRFDVCVVDEASQVLQPACLGPLFHADRFALVGDPQQLPPVVQSKEASALGMGESLFARLDGAGATYDLHLQYRMNSTIMQLSNELVYKGALACGDDTVAQACIQPRQILSEGEAEWLSRALDDSLPNAVVFLDTHQIHAPEKSDSKGLTNATEAGLIHRLCTVFVQAGISASDMGVIAPYRAQVRLLQKQFSECCPLKEVEVNTVDQYQGRDKSVVLISFVRSTSLTESDSSHRGALLQDVRRLNVAVTRAKHKLVLVGNSTTLQHYEPLQVLLNNLRSRGQLCPLPADLQVDEDADTK